MLRDGHRRRGPDEPGRHDQPGALRRLAGEGDGHVAIDPRKLRPSELCRLLNSTPLGEVINERQLYRHRTRAGFRIGDGRHVDLFRYVAWLVEVRHDAAAGAGRRSLRDAQGTCPGPQRGAVAGRPRHRRAAGGRRSRAEGAGGVELPVLLRVLLPADVPPALVARPPEGDRQDRAGRAARRAVRDGHAPRQRQDDASVSAPASGPCSTATATSSA